ncbi:MULTISPECIES: hypothetical protein [unclassified Arthrobacter]|uniref:hypothetical protein n=1 Tax=unclassified Arthrobacter TaxID=235627 RepID=UPI0033949A39
MRQMAGTLNRTWLTIVGIIFLAGGIALLLQSAGALQSLANTAPAGAKVVSDDLYPFFAQLWAVVLLLVIGAIIGGLGLLWVAAQIPRKNPAAAYRLHAGGAQGRTICEPSVLATAVEKQVNTLPGVLGSSAILRGTAEEPDLTLKVTVNDRADVRELLRLLETSTLPELSTALEAPLQRRRLQIDISGRTLGTGTVVPSTGTVLK